MGHQKLFLTRFVNELRDRVQNNASHHVYISGQITYCDNDIQYNPHLNPPDKIDLLMPTSKDNYDFENSQKLFLAYRDMNPVQATDARIWTYLSHITFWDYMRRRYPVEEQPSAERASFILQHWFIESVNVKNLLRHGISLLWWCAYLTYDKTNADPFMLTRELFSDLDYTRSLVPSTQGRNPSFLHAVLEYVAVNPQIFSKYKEDKVRFVMRKLNYMAGYRVLCTLSKTEIMKLVGSFKDEIEVVKPA
jgi:hypothetical protein